MTEVQYLYDAGDSGVGGSSRNGTTFTYKFNLASTTAATLMGIFGSNTANGAWSISASKTATGTYTTVASGIGFLSSQTINLNVFTGGTVFLKFTGPGFSGGIQMANLLLLSWKLGIVRIVRLGSGPRFFFGIGRCELGEIDGANSTNSERIRTRPPRRGALCSPLQPPEPEALL